jgi:hypothetical protein
MIAMTTDPKPPLKPPCMNTLRALALAGLGCGFAGGAPAQTTIAATNITQTAAQLNGSELLAPWRLRHQQQY